MAKVKSQADKKGADVTVDLNKYNNNVILVTRIFFFFFYSSTSF